MFIVLYTALFLLCSTGLSIAAFLVGRCGHRLPIDGTLPRVVHSARFDTEPDHTCDIPGPSGASWPNV
jgi:hypothetical protein